MKELENDVENTILIYERIAGISATRTREMIEKKGYTQALSDLVISGEIQTGFKKLVKAGKINDTFESLIVKYKERFPKKIIEAAQFRLDHYKELMEK